MHLTIRNLLIAQSSHTKYKCPTHEIQIPGPTVFLIGYMYKQPFEQEIYFAFLRKAYKADTECCRHDTSDALDNLCKQC